MNRILNAITNDISLVTREEYSARLFPSATFPALIITAHHLLKTHQRTVRTDRRVRIIALQIPVAHISGFLHVKSGENAWQTGIP